VRVIREYLKLIRPYGILFLGFAPVFGAVCNEQYDVFSLALLLLIGVLGHIFVFVQNDYYDVEVDRRSKYVVQRPLTSGALPRTHARLLFICSFFLSVVFTGVFFFSLRSFLTLFLSFSLMTLYNKYCKKYPGMEYILGAAVFTYGIFGAFTVSDQVSVFALIISCVGFLQWIFSVGISANLKDVEFDTKLGIRTTPVRFGVRAVGHQLKKPVSFVLYTYGLKLLHLIVALLPFLFGFSSPLLFGYPLPLFGFLLLAALLMFTTWGILTTPLGKRDQMLRYEGAHEGLALLLIPCVLGSYLVEHLGGLFVCLLFVLFIAWPLLCLRFLYGKTLIPLE
jgi:4-hydroxybenzoate polyprenyltransferase